LFSQKLFNLIKMEKLIKKTKEQQIKNVEDTSCRCTKVSLAKTLIRNLRRICIHIFILVQSIISCLIVEK